MDGQGFGKIMTDAAKGLAILFLVAGLLIGGCCAGVGTYIYQNYSVTVKEKDSK